MRAGTPMRVFLAIALLLTAAPAAAQPAASALTGQVLSVIGDAPLRRARVRVMVGRQTLDPVFSDDQGRFAVGVTGTGPFDVTVEKAGYLTAKTVVSRKELASELVVRLPRGAVIAGMVLDQNGRPAFSQRVRVRALDGDASGAGRENVLTVFTDDLGEFRMAGLARGRYEVGAEPDPIVITGTSATGWPVRTQIGADSADRDGRQLVTVESGDEVTVQLSVQRTEDEAFIAEMLAKSGVVNIQLGAPTARTTEPPGSAAISGRVITESGQPVNSATLRLSRSGTEHSLRTRTDGQFSFAGLRPGDYALEVSAPGFATMRYGQTRAGDPGTLIPLAADERVQGVEVILRRGPIVSGIIVDDHGEAIQGVRVRAVRLEYQAGRMTATRMFAERPTDDRGYYRLVGLLPGTYVVSAIVEGAIVGRPDASPVAYAPVYYPGVTDLASAIPLDVNADVVADVALSLLPGGIIRGLAMDGQAPLVSGTARLVETLRSGAMSGAPREATIQPSGRFLIPNVPPGEYVVQIAGDGPGRTGLFGTRIVTVPATGDAVDLVVTTSYGTTLTGRFTIDGTVDLPACVTSQGPGAQVQARCGTNWSPGAGFSIAPVALDDRARPVATFAVGGSGFMLSGLFGHTALNLRQAPGDEWFLKSVTINGVDVTESGFDFGSGATAADTIDGAEIIVSRNGASLSGTVDSSAAAGRDYFVVVFPPFRDQWTAPHLRRMKLTRSRGDGSFRVGGLPAGDYLVAAVNRLEGSFGGGEWQNPAVLEQLAPRAERVTLSDGQSRELSLRLIAR
jgi:hypothetical protein